MLLLGILLVCGTAAFTALLIADNFAGGPQYTVTLLGHHVATLSTLGAFLAGAALALVFCAALLLATAGARRERRRNAELRTARRDRKKAARILVADRDRDLAKGAGAAIGTDDSAQTASSVPSKRRSRGLHLFGN